MFSSEQQTEIDSRQCSGSKVKRFKVQDEIEKDTLTMTKARSMSVTLPTLQTQITRSVHFPRKNDANLNEYAKGLEQL